MCSEKVHSTIIQLCKRSFDAGDDPTTLALECNQNDLERLDDCRRRLADWRVSYLVGRLVQQRDHIALHYSQFSETMHQIREEEGMNMSAIVFLKIVYSSFIQSLSQKEEWLVHAFNQYALFEFDVQFWIPNCEIIKLYDMVHNRIYLGV